MNTDDYFLFFDSSTEEGDCGEVSWILAKRDGFEIQRGEYKLKSKLADKSWCPDAYFSSFLADLIERVISIYSPDFVLFAESQKADLMRLNHSDINGFRQIILLEKLGQNRGLNGFSDLEEMHCFLLPWDVSHPVGADQVKGCYYKLINQNLTFAGRIKEIFDPPLGKTYSTYQGRLGHKLNTGALQTENHKRVKGWLALIWDFIVRIYLVFMVGAFLAAFISLFIDIGKSIMKYFS